MKENIYNPNILTFCVGFVIPGFCYSQVHFKCPVRVLFPPLDKKDIHVMGPYVFIQVSQET
jgi:hypothetical protein